MSLNKEEILKNYLSLADSLYILLLSENKQLRDSQELPNDFLLQKQTLLNQFNDATNNLNLINNTQKTEGIHSNDLIKASQQKTMKILLLQRENEQLLHKNTFNNQSNLTTLPPSKRSALAAYSQNPNNS